MGGAVVGTAAYMSPEQAHGQTLDERSDVFSFGSVLYEMISGRQAFAGDSMLSVMSSVARDEPSPLNVSPEISGIVRRCMRKDPADRFQTISEVKAALEQCSAKPAEKQPSIAVLPFTNLSADKENEYFSDGLAEEILNALSQVEGLKVAARASSFSFKGKGAEMSEVGARLRVATVLDGSVRRAGNRVRVTVQLVDVSNGYQLWSERYDRQMEDIFEVQDEIARAIAEKLKVTLGAGVVKQSTKNAEAYDLYLKGRHFWHQRSPGTLRLAIEAFEKAIQLDPEYALAYAGLSDCHGLFRIYGWVRKEDVQPKALAAVTKAMTLGASLWEIQYSRAIYGFYFERNWREAEQYFRNAVEINPRSSLAQVYFGAFLITAGRGEESLERIAIASRLDPLSAFIHVLTGAALSFLRDFDAAERATRQALDLQPGYLFSLWNRGLGFCASGRAAEAIALLEQVVAVSRAPIYLGFLGLAYGRAGNNDDAHRLLGELDDRASRGEYIMPLARVFIYTGLNDLPAIRRTFAEAVEDLDVLFLKYAITQFPEEVLDDPEMKELLSRI
jgi:serine/threonine-protein kinase